MINVEHSDVTHIHVSINENLIMVYKDAVLIWNVTGEKSFDCVIIVNYFPIEIRERFLWPPDKNIYIVYVKNTTLKKRIPHPSFCITRPVPFYIEITNNQNSETQIVNII